jgi:hypothetical protein
LKKKIGANKFLEREKKVGRKQGEGSSGCAPRQGRAGVMAAIGEGNSVVKAQVKQPPSPPSKLQQQQQLQVCTYSYVLPSQVLNLFEEKSWFVMLFPFTNCRTSECQTSNCGHH